jgi:hypothetical protein
MSKRATSLLIKLAGVPTALLFREAWSSRRIWIKYEYTLNFNDRNKDCEESVVILIPFFITFLYMIEQHATLTHIPIWQLRRRVWWVINTIPKLTITSRVAWTRTWSTVVQRSSGSKCLITHPWRTDWITHRNTAWIHRNNPCNMYEAQKTRVIAHVRLGRLFTPLLPVFSADNSFSHFISSFFHSLWIYGGILLQTQLFFVRSVFYETVYFSRRSPSRSDSSDFKGSYKSVIFSPCLAPFQKIGTIHLQIPIKYNCSAINVHSCEYLYSALLQGKNMTVDT